MRSVYHRAAFCRGMEVPAAARETLEIVHFDGHFRFVQGLELSVYSGREARTVAEFDLSRLEGEVADVSLEVRTSTRNFPSAGVPIGVSLYAGDGTVTEEDFTAGEHAMEFRTEEGLSRIPLPASRVESVRRQSRYLGVRLQLLRQEPIVYVDLAEQFSPRGAAWRPLPMLLVNRRLDVLREAPLVGVQPGPDGRREMRLADGSAWREVEGGDPTPLPHYGHAMVLSCGERTVIDVAGAARLVPVQRIE